ncbi:hypothetical protein IV203_005535 [Nitzschia inconspicua]|uniref:Uncharacterized protein n=1 Tax=Nitzschia inconspicua TaxID=303405 RepID=A0A9K3PG55_9STRA|nr:hypothetical protein IV203_005535 [Nitzschia inconspicua]
MKVQDRILAMNKVIEQEELLEPLEMMGGTESIKSPPGSYPKRSSVVEMWKKRESVIKKASTYHFNHDKFEEKKEGHSNEDPVNMQQVELGDSDGGVQQREKMTAITTQASGLSTSRLITPERSGPESDDNSNNVGSSVRRSSIRQSWKKKAPVVNSYPTPFKTVSLSIDASRESSYRSSGADNEPMNGFLGPSSAENETAPYSIPSTPSPGGQSTTAIQSTWRKIDDPKAEPSPSTPQSNSSSFVNRSQSRVSSAGESPVIAASPASAFDELRSKWAKFGVQKEQAGAAGRAKPIMPSPIVTQSPKASPAPSFQTVPCTQDPYSSQVGKPMEGQAATQENPPSSPSPRPADESPMIGGRKNQLVKMGQMHALRPKADTLPGSKCPIKRCTPSKYCPSSFSATSQNDTTRNMASATQPESSIKRIALQKSAELRAKQRRRAQQAQSSSAACVLQNRFGAPQRPSNQELSQELSDDSFPLDEMGPDSFRDHFKYEQDATIARPTLPMRTLFGSQSGESLNLGPSNEKVIHSLGDPRLMSQTEVLKTTFDSWSDIESFSVEGPSNDSGSGKLQPSNSNLTNSALKRLREKRQTSYTPKSDVPDKYQYHDLAEPATPQPDFSASAGYNAPENGASYRGYQIPSSPDVSSAAVSQSVGSDTSFSNSYMQSTYTSGYTKSAPTLSDNKTSNLHSTLKDVVANADDMIPDEFVSEKDANVQSFRTAYENLSLEQIARDMREEASSILSLDFLNHDLLNKSMSAAGASLNKLVAGDIFQAPNHRRLLKRATSPVEEVAIEVEYIADSDDEP